MTLHAEVADELRRRIQAGELPLGAALPSEAQLRLEWSTSRGTVRQALAALRAEGLIGGGRGSPPVVRSRQLSQPFETFLSFTTWAQRAGREPGQRTLEVTRLPAPDDVAGALAIEPGEPVVRVLRLRLLDGEPAMVERAVFPLRYGACLLAADLDRQSIYATLTDAGVHATSARHTFGAVPADETDARLLDLAPGYPLLQERRQATLANGDLLEVADDRYRSDLITFTVTNTPEAHTALARSWSSHAAH